MRTGEDDATPRPFDGRAAFEEAVVDAIPSMLRLAVRLCGDVHVAEDVVQDALMRAAKSIGSFRGDAGLTTWLSSIVINAFRDRLPRMQRERSHQSLGDEIDRADGPARSAEADEFGAIVARCVSQLPPRQREVLVLVAYEGLSGRAAADVLAISEQDVRTNLHYARQRMRELLKPYVEGGVKR
jgi:RNA polymerase sigma-70 factor, ECF subfamily